MTKKVAASPERHTFQIEGYIKRKEQEGTEPDPQYLDWWEQVKIDSANRVNDPEWQQYNMEYDLRSTDWIIKKCKEDRYAQNLYAAICNNQFAKFTQTGDRIETYRNLREEYWSASWRSAGGIVADVRGEGDYIDWYCSGIGDGLGNGDSTGVKGYVSESVITDEIRDDLAKLGWVGFPWKDED